MQIRIPSPKHYEAVHGSSELVRKYLDQIEVKLGEVLTSEVIDILHISILIAEPEKLAAGKFLEYEKFDWRSGYTAVGVNGNFERYHLGNDLDKIRELSEMLQAAFLKIGKKKKAKFDYKLANTTVLHATNTFVENN